MENISHGGPGSEPIGPFTIFTWGNGAALATAAKALDTYGDAYIDAARGVGFGIDGCRVDMRDGTYVVRDPYRRERLRVRMGDTVRELDASDGVAEIVKGAGEG